MKILLVEDDLTLAEEIVRLCRKWGFEAEYLEEFEAVDREWKKRQGDLILMDINLPFYDGFYWAREIRKISRVPILFLSSRDQNSDKVMAMVSGGDDYVEKPFDGELLLVKIRALLRRAYEYTVSDREYLAEEPDPYVSDRTYIVQEDGETYACGEGLEGETAVVKVMVSEE